MSSLDRSATSEDSRLIGKASHLGSPPKGILFMADHRGNL